MVDSLTIIQKVEKAIENRLKAVPQNHRLILSSLAEDHFVQIFSYIEDFLVLAKTCKTFNKIINERIIYPFVVRIQRDSLFKQVTQEALDLLPLATNRNKSLAIVGAFIKQTKALPKNVKNLQKINWRAFNLHQLEKTLGWYRSTELIAVYNEVKLSKSYLQNLPKDLKISQDLLDFKIELITEIRTYFNASHITFLDLSKLNLTYLVSEIGHLNLLQNLNISNNHLVELPLSFGNLTRLTNLNLAHNKLAYLPKSFENLTALTNLNLLFNCLKKLPMNFGKNKQLMRINLCSNNLMKLPKSFTELTNLRTLSLLYNEITHLPKNFGKLTNLQNLNITCQLTHLPKSFKKLTQLTYLHIELKRLEELPKNLKDLPDLKIVSTLR